jgi:S-DNA-T family DNA segregation ATPase FtsK/SpoIIIE
VTTEWAESVARALAPLADAGADASLTIPATCFLFDLLGLDRGDLRSAIVERWRSGKGRPRTAVGLGAQGVVELDLISDGPHMLVAGTTGSGKSELLQSLVAGLSIANAPGQVAFVLVDYKGGATFVDCGRLPHTLGVVTDLDAHLTRRALRSLDAELRRREVLFADVGARDLDQYHRTTTGQHGSLHRLVLIVDEFATLAEELPDFLDGLIDIAQRGRSLGIHLILATQRPGGVISPEIRANTALRIALRVTDTNESVDVVGTPAAAAIDKQRPGRACVRTGSTVTEMQTARIAEVVPSSQRIRVESLDHWGRPIASPPSRVDKTDLQLLADATYEATFVTDALVPQPPWLPPLTHLLPITDLDDVPGPDLIPLGVVDLPDIQQQVPLVVDLSRAGPCLVVGGAGSGRTTALSTAVAVTASRLSCESLHAYVIDCAGGDLRAVVADLPHCAAVLSRDDFDAIARLIERLTDLAVQRRSNHAATSTVASTARAEPQRALLVVDGWEGFAIASEEHDGGRTVDAFLGLLRDATSIGMTVLVAGDRTALAPRLAGIVSRRFVLRLVDRADYALAGIPAHHVPVRMPPGRAIRTEDHAEVQFAVLGRDASPAEQRRAVAAIAAAARPRATAPVISVRPLPRRVQLADLRPAERARPTLGVGGDRAEPIHLDLFAAPGTFLVAGPPRSGRTTALTVIGKQLHSMAIEVIVAAPARSDLASFACALGIPVWDRNAPGHSLTAASHGRRVILVDDAETFLDSAVEAALAEITRQQGSGQISVVAARTDDLTVSYRGLLFDAQRGRTGLLLQPAASDGELLGVRVRRARTTALPGRGVLVGDLPRLTGVVGSGNLMPVQVASP